MDSAYHQEMNKLDAIQLAAEKGGDQIFFYDLLGSIEKNSKEWIFHQITSDLSLEQHSRLIKKKHGIINYVQKELSNLVE